MRPLKPSKPWRQIISRQERPYSCADPGSFFKLKREEPNTPKRGPSSARQRNERAQWLSGRVLISRPRSRGFEPHRRHIYPSLVLVQPRKTRPCLTNRLLMGRKESNQTKQNKASETPSIAAVPMMTQHGMPARYLRNPYFLWFFRGGVRISFPPPLDPRMQFIS